MPPNGPPTARRQRLATELRKLRERTGLSATAAGALLGATQAQISNIEAARAGVSAERVRALARIYDCMDESLIDALAGMTGDRERHWWEEYRGILPAGMLDLAELERHAGTMQVAYTVHLPGLLQTDEHARAVFRQVVPRLSPPDVEHRVSFRIKRQAVIYRDDPIPLTAILHEAALRMKFGGTEVARRQLNYLLELGERDHITIRVVPFDAGEFPGSGQSIFYATGPVPQLDTVQLDQSHGTLLLDAETQLHKYRVILDRMEDVALNPDESRTFIRGIEHELGRA